MGRLTGKYSSENPPPVSGIDAIVIMPCLVESFYQFDQTHYLK